MKSEGMKGDGMAEELCCCHKHKERSEKEYRDLILVQVAAANAALNSFNKVLLANHIRTCVADDIRDGKEETIDELVTVLQKLMK